MFKLSYIDLNMENTECMWLCFMGGEVQWLESTQLAQMHLSLL